MSELLTKDDILEATCPECAGVLIVRVNKRLQNAFVGCTGFPRCTHTREVKDSDRKFDPLNHASESERSSVGERTYNGCLCEVCHEKQFDTLGGVTCENGHGGAGSIDINTGEVTYPNEKVDWDGMAESTRVVDNQDVVPEDDGVNLITVRLTYFKRSGKYYSRGSFMVDCPDFHPIVDKVRKMHSEGKLPDLIEGSGKDMCVLIEPPDRDCNEVEGVPYILRPVDDEDLRCNQCGLDGAKDRRLNGVGVGELCQVCWKSVIACAFDACSEKG